MKATKEILFLFLCKDCLTIIHLQVIPKFTKKARWQEHVVTNGLCYTIITKHLGTTTDHGQLLFVSNILHHHHNHINDHVSR